MSEELKRLARTLLLSSLAALLLTGAVRAEVGALVTDTKNAAAARPYILGIIDESDPVGAVWTPYHNSSARYTVLNPTGWLNEDGPPSILWHPDTKTAIVAWAQKNPDGYDVVVSQHQSTGWTTPQKIAASIPYELDPYLFLDRDGRVHVVYWVEDEGTMWVEHCHAPADLSQWSDPQRVSAQGERASRPAGVYHGDLLFVAYEVETFAALGGKDVVLAQWVDGAFHYEVLATPPSNGPLWARPHSEAGRLWVDWIDTTFGSPPTGELAWLRQTQTGRWETTQYEPFTGSEERDYHVRPRARFKALTQP